MRLVRPKQGISGALRLVIIWLVASNRLGLPPSLYEQSQRTLDTCCRPTFRLVWAFVLVLHRSCTPGSTARSSDPDKSLHTSIRSFCNKELYCIAIKTVTLPFETCFSDQTAYRLSEYFDPQLPFSGSSPPLPTS